MNIFVGEMKSTRLFKIIVLITLNAESIIMHMNTMTKDLHENPMQEKTTANKCFLYKHVLLQCFVGPNLPEAPTPMFTSIESLEASTPTLNKFQPTRSTNAHCCLREHQPLHANFFSTLAMLLTQPVMKIFSKQIFFLHLYRSLISGHTLVEVFLYIYLYI